jgi:3-hydroxybutyrate dehydrogenase
VVELESTVALSVQCDITKEADLHLLVTKVEALAKSHSARLWAVVNNAGVANSGNLDLVSSKACRQVMEVNFFALFEVTRAFLPLLKQTKDSRVINISSAAGLTGSYQMGVYCGKIHARHSFLFTLIKSHF